MAKSIKSKIKRKFRAAKRVYLNEHVEKKKIEDKHQKLMDISQGLTVTVPAQPKNAFLHPGEPDAIIPVVEITKAHDLRLTVLNA